MGGFDLIQASTLPDFTTFKPTNKLMPPSTCIYIGQNYRRTTNHQKPPSIITLPSISCTNWICSIGKTTSSATGSFAPYGPIITDKILSSIGLSGNGVQLTSIHGPSGINQPSPVFKLKYLIMMARIHWESQQEFYHSRWQHLFTLALPTSWANDLTWVPPNEPHAPFDYITWILDMQTPLWHFALCNNNTKRPPAILPPCPHPYLLHSSSDSS